jgi:hypothetical protein
MTCLSSGLYECLQFSGPKADTSPTTSIQHAAPPLRCTRCGRTYTPTIIHVDIRSSPNP